MMDVQHIFAFIQLHSAFAGPIVFAVAFLGCLLGTNLIVPAGAIITGMGVLSGAGAISWTFVIWAACGAALGMSASYAIGLRLGARIETLPLLRTRPELILRARRLFATYGFIAILIGYFSGPLRAPIAGVAALAGMPRGRFEVANISSSMIWTIVAAAVGALPGTLVDLDSPWWPVSLAVGPAVTVAISAAIYLWRMHPDRR